MRRAAATFLSRAAAHEGGWAGLAATGAARLLRFGRRRHRRGDAAASPAVAHLFVTTASGRWRQPVSRHSFCSRSGPPAHSALRALPHLSASSLTTLRPPTPPSSSPRSFQCDERARQRPSRMVSLAILVRKLRSPGIPGSSASRAPYRAHPRSPAPSIALCSPAPVPRRTREELLHAQRTGRVVPTVFSGMNGTVQAIRCVHARERGR